MNEPQLLTSFGVDSASECQFITVQLHIVCTIDLYPLVVTVQVQHRVLSFLHQAGISHQMGGSMEGRKVVHLPYPFGQSRTYKIPDGPSYQAGMSVDGFPIIVQGTAGIACNR